MHVGLWPEHVVCARGASTLLTVDVYSCTTVSNHIILGEIDTVGTLTMLCMYLTTDTTEPKLNCQTVHFSRSAKHSKCCLMPLISIFAGSLPIHHIWQVPGCNIKTQKYSAECHIAHCRQQEWDIWSETLSCTIRGPSLNELLVGCGRAKVSHQRHKKDGGLGIWVFSFVVSSAFPHCTNIVGPVRSLSSCFMLLQCHVTLQLSCQIRPSSCWPFAESTSWASPWNWNARRCQRYVCSLPHIVMLALEHVVLSSVSIDHTWAAKTNLWGMYTILNISSVF